MMVLPWYEVLTYAAWRYSLITQQICHSKGEFNTLQTKRISSTITFKAVAQTLDI